MNPNTMRAGRSSHARRAAAWGAALLMVGAGITAAAASASADDLAASPDPLNITLSPTPTPGATTGAPVTRTVTVTLVAVNDDGHAGCNLENEKNSQGHGLNASVVSSNTAVATVSPSTLHFTRCGAEGAKTFDVTGLSTGSSTISITPTDWRSANPNNVVFNADTVVVNVTIGDGTGIIDDIDTCSRPAAPAWANAFLKASGVKNKTTIQNTISAVAKRMIQGAAMPPATEGGEVVGKDSADYAGAVYDYMASIPVAGLKPRSEALAGAIAIRPGWECS